VFCHARTPQNKVFYRTFHPVYSHKTDRASAPPLVTPALKPLRHRYQYGPEYSRSSIKKGVVLMTPLVKTFAKSADVYGGHYLTINARSVV
jgi:hypothetical protein